MLERMLRRIDEILARRDVRVGRRSTSSTTRRCPPSSTTRSARRSSKGVAAALLGADAVGRPSRDRAPTTCRYFLEAAPGAYFLLGAAPRNAEHVYPHHHPRFDFDEAAMPLGIELALRIIEAATGSTLG